MLSWATPLRVISLLSALDLCNVAPCCETHRFQTLLCRYVVVFFRAPRPQVLCILCATVTVLAYAVNGNEFFNESLPDQECESVPVSATKVRFPLWHSFLNVKI